MRSYQPGDSNTCAGTIVASRYIITAAHCVSQINNNTGEFIPALPYHVTISVGLLGSQNVPFKKVSVTKVSIHPQYHYTGMNDVAILELSERLDLSIYTPACLSRTSDIGGFVGMEVENILLRDDQDRNDETRKNQRSSGTTVIDSRHCYDRFDFLRYQRELDRYLLNTHDDSLICTLKYDDDFLIEVSFHEFAKQTDELMSIGRQWRTFDVLREWPVRAHWRCQSGGFI